MTRQLKVVLQWRLKCLKKNTLNMNSLSDLRGFIPMVLLALNCILVIPGLSGDYVRSKVLFSLKYYIRICPQKSSKTSKSYFRFSFKEYHSEVHEICRLSQLHIAERRTAFHHYFFHFSDSFFSHELVLEIFLELCEDFLSFMNS